MSIIMYNK